MTYDFPVSPKRVAEAACSLVLRLEEEGSHLASDNLGENPPL